MQSNAPASPEKPLFSRVTASAAPSAAATSQSQRATGIQPAQFTATDLQRYASREWIDKLSAARTRGEMVGERRVVTMLFCDVVGSTAAAEKLDPEDWTEIMNGTFEYMIPPVYKYEGTVARLMGDAILAFFGAPITHEDDPQRAILTGLDIVGTIQPYREHIKERYGIDFDVRVGINTGMVVVGAVGSDLRMEYTALGDAINLAARMEQTADPGTVRISHETYKLTKDQFEFEALGGVDVKGKAEPVSVYRVLRRKTQLSRQRGIEGLHAEMVGRQVEMATIDSTLADLKLGVGRIVSLIGEAGLGKTRLIGESHKLFVERIGDGGSWYASGSLSYESNQAYGLFRRLMQRVCGITYDDPELVVREKLASLIETMNESHSYRAREVFGALFGLQSENGGSSLEGESFKLDLFAAMQTWWQSGFANRPTVLVFDDIHWSDAASIELLGTLLPLIEEIPLVILCSMRPERGSPAWMIKHIADDEYRHRYTEINLNPLSEEESNLLVDRLLAIAEIPNNLRASILEKSLGNPYFIEEVVRTLIDNNVVFPEERSHDGVTRRYWRAASDQIEFEIPNNLQSLLATRIDRLDEETRYTLQVAAVIGRSFFHRILKAVEQEDKDLEKHISALMRVEMIRESARVPEVEYAFRNPLTQEAVYNTILLRRRREFHLRVGEAMEVIYADRLDGFYNLLAYHFSLAGETAKAIGYYRRIAGQAVALFAYEETVHNLSIALNLVDPKKDLDLQIQILEALADVRRLLRDFWGAIEIYQRLLVLLNELPEADPVAAIRLNRKIIEVITDLKWSVSLEELNKANPARVIALTNLEAGVQQIQSESPELEVIRGLVALSMDAWRMQEPPDWNSARELASQAVELAEHLGSPVDLSQALGALATVLDGCSLLRDHLDVAQKRFQLVQDGSIDHLQEKMESVRGLGAAWMNIGEYKQALPYLQEAYDLALRTQLVAEQADALGMQALCYYRLDRWEDVLSLEGQWKDLDRRYTRERVGAT